MWATDSVQFADLTRSTPFRFALALTALFLAAYLAAGLVAYQSVSAALDERVVEAVELIAARLENTLHTQNRQALVAEVDARLATDDPEFDIVWLGTADGRRLAGRSLDEPLELRPGDVSGARFAMDPEDRYRVVVRDFDHLRLIAAKSYEEVEEIGETVQDAFTWATLSMVLLAVIGAILLARRGQRRLAAITTTLQAVALGDMAARVPVAKSNDDVGQLSRSINDALGQLETTVDGIRQVSTDIAHDLRTPISRLGILIERARTQIEADAPVAEELAAATREIRGIAATFDSLLRIAQIGSAGRTVRLGGVSLSALARDLHEVYLPVAEENHQRLLLDSLPAKEALVLGARNLLTQLFANLIENAIGHCPPRTRIQITVQSRPDAVTMSIADDGPGIAPSERHNVLKRFYRLDKSRSSEGSGLGLALVKAIADLHGAKLSLGDNRPGLVVQVRFPLYKTETAPTREQS